MTVSPIEGLELLCRLHIVIVVFHGGLRTFAVWLTPALYAYQQMQIRRIWHDLGRYCYLSSCVWVVTYFFASPRLPLGLQIVAYGLLGLFTILPLWWLRGLVGGFLCAQGLVVLLGVGVWPALISELNERWMLLASLGGYLFLFVVTLLWRQR
jgi:hypothetical protein